MKDAEFAALLAGLKEPDALDDVRRAYTQAEGKGGSHAQANP